jgi:hypothetical protein
LQRLGVTDIFVILIYTLYPKKKKKTIPTHSEIGIAICISCDIGIGNRVNEYVKELAEHKLHVDPKVRPIKQSLRPFNTERHRAIGEEVNRLLVAGFIREIKHHKWLANPVPVLKEEKHMENVYRLH